MKIIHIDMDAFYASVEQRDRPELRGRPVVVGGDPRGRGVVSTASYEARPFGVRSAMSAAKAHRLCPHAVFLKPDFSKYTAVSRQIRAIFHSVTDLVEPLSLDEAYLDVTANHWGEPSATRVAMEVRRRIQAETGLTASAGVGPNKFIAKVASDFQKPDGLTVVPPERVDEFVSKLSVERLWGVGPATSRRLHELGFRTAGELRSAGLSMLESEFGRFGRFIWELAHGRDERQVESAREPKSRGSETTFSRDVTDLFRLAGVLREQAAEVSEDLKRISRAGRTVTIKVRYPDFSTVTRSRTLARPTDDPEEIARVAIELLETRTEVGVRPVRLLGVSVSGMDGGDDPVQLWLPFDGITTES